MLTIDQIRTVVADYFQDKPVKKVWLFGSYARGDNSEEGSDIDLLFTLKDNTRMSYLTLAHYALDLESRLKNRVDLVAEHLLFPFVAKGVTNDKMLLVEQ